MSSHNEHLEGVAVLTVLNDILNAGLIPPQPASDLIDNRMPIHKKKNFMGVDGFNGCSIYRYIRCQMLGL